MSNRARLISWAAQLVAAVILGQTLFFKFSGAPESIFIFSSVGIEPWGRYATALTELVAVVMLLTPRTAALGALLAIAVMVGALGSHLLFLGIEVQGDGGTLFVLALVVTAAASVVLWLRRAQLPLIGRRTASDHG